MINCIGCGAEIRGKVNGSNVEGVCIQCLPRYFNGEFGEQNIINDTAIEQKEIKKKKGYAPNAGVSKKEAKTLSITTRFNQEQYDSILNQVVNTDKPASVYIREVMVEHLKTINENKMEDKI